MKVFSLEKYKKERGYTDKEVSAWAREVAGMPLDEIKKKYCYLIADEWIEERIMKKDLKENDIVTLRNGDRLVLVGEDFIDLSDDNGNNLCDLSDLDNNLECVKCYGKVEDCDIVKVERPVEYETVFEREDVQELTVDEISERLGYKVKVVGEDR